MLRSDREGARLRSENLLKGIMMVQYPPQENLRLCPTTTKHDHRGAPLNSALHESALTVSYETTFHLWSQQMIIDSSSLL